MLYFILTFTDQNGSIIYYQCSKKVVNNAFQKERKIVYHTLFLQR